MVAIIIAVVIVVLALAVTTGLLVRRHLQKQRSLAASIETPYKALAKEDS